MLKSHARTTGSSRAAHDLLSALRLAATISRVLTLVGAVLILSEIGLALTAMLLAAALEVNASLSYSEISTARLWFELTSAAAVIAAPGVYLVFSYGKVVPIEEELVPVQELLN